MNSSRRLLRAAPRLFSAARLTLRAPVLAAVGPSPARLSSQFSSRAALLENARFRGGPLWDKGEVVTYDELKPLTENPSDDVLLVDVREPNEVALGSIPSSVNLPLSGFEKSLSLDEGDFTRIHGFHKPDKKQPIIFYCRAGVRAGTAVDLAKRAGFKNLRNYEGSYLDWLEKDGGANKDD